MGATTASSAGERLRAHGLRPTAQRVAVLEELAREPNDATAQVLHERLRAAGRPIGLATVYRTLDALAEARLVEPLAHFREALCYRVCGDGHHHHLVCSECHAIVELDGCELEEPLAAVAAGHGYVVTSHHLEVVGLCAACAAAGRGRS
jgi:Fur family ferric uptake transcriptional regulator